MHSMLYFHNIFTIDIDKRLKVLFIKHVRETENVIKSRSKKRRKRMKKTRRTKGCGEWVERRLNRKRHLENKQNKTKKEKKKRLKGEGLFSIN